MKLVLLRIITFVFIFSQLGINGQEIKDDINYLIKTKKTIISYKNHPEAKLKLSFNPVKTLPGLLIFIYQTSFSDQFQPSCIFYPSCSDYCIQCVTKGGSLKYILKCGNRLMRCNRINIVYYKSYPYYNKKVYDPVVINHEIHKEDN